MWEPRLEQFVGQAVNQLVRQVLNQLVWQDLWWRWLLVLTVSPAGRLGGPPAGDWAARRVVAVLGCLGLLVAACTANGPGTHNHDSRSRIGATERAGGKRYLVIATAGNRRLNADFDPLENRDRNDLARAKADLRDAARTEFLFDRRLLRIGFPSGTERVARDLYLANEARARLTSAAAASTSLRQLHAYEPRLDAANKPVEHAVRTIRRQLGLPPPPTS